jgi:hypothetical protein
MNQYEQALVYDLQGNHRGSVIIKNIQGGSIKLQSLNLWTDAELLDLQEQLDRLNSELTIKAHWPRQDDPEVQALLQNPNWEPVEMVASEEVDLDQSYIVHKDDNPESDIDYEASVIVNRPVMVPSRTGASARIRLAMETVARQRVNGTTGPV